MAPRSDDGATASSGYEPLVGNHEAGARAWASLSARDRVSTVERAVAEVRKGLPVLLRDGSRVTLVVAAEALCADGSAAAWRHAGAGLVLPAARLRYLGIDTAEPQRFDTADWSQQQLCDALFAPAADHFTSGQPASTEDAAGVHLLKLAQLLPAALTSVVPAGMDVGHLVDTEAASVLHHHDAVARSLRIVARTRVPLIDSEVAEFILFDGSDGLRDQLALLIGAPDALLPVPVRVHSACLSGDLFGSLRCDCGEQLRFAVRHMSGMGGGVLLYLDQEGRGIGLRNKIRAYQLQENDHDTVDADGALGYEPDERRYRIAARMLTLLGYPRVVLLTNNPAKVQALESNDLEVAGSVPLLGTINPHNARYLATKAGRSNHALGELLKSSGPEERTKAVQGKVGSEKPHRLR